MNVVDKIESQPRKVEKRKIFVVSHHKFLLILPVGKILLSYSPYSIKK